MRPRALTGAALAAALALMSAAETYRGIDIAPEHRCAPYDRSDYRYSQSLEPRIVASIGKVYGPYTSTCFGSTGETDIEHMVATSEAHDGALCAASRSVRAAFASDLLNLTLASPSVNRYSKSGKDVAEWTLEVNACWFVARTLEVRRKYGLTIAREEAAAAEAVLSRCRATTMEVLPCAAAGPPSPTSSRGTSPARDVDPLALWDDYVARNIWTTTAMGASRAPRRGGTASHRCRGTIRRTGTCATGTATAWSASRGRRGASQRWGCPSHHQRLTLANDARTGATQWRPRRAQEFHAPLDVRANRGVAPDGERAFLHHFLAPDHRCLHNHPWPLDTLLLSGGYSALEYRPAAGPAIIEVMCRAGARHRLGGGAASSDYHCVTAVEPDTWTLLRPGSPPSATATSSSPARPRPARGCTSRPRRDTSTAPRTGPSRPCRHRSSATATARRGTSMGPTATLPPDHDALARAPYAHSPPTPHTLPNHPIHIHPTHLPSLSNSPPHELSPITNSLPLELTPLTNSHPSRTHSLSNSPPLELTPLTNSPPPHELTPITNSPPHELTPTIPHHLHPPPPPLFFHPTTVNRYISYKPITL